MLMGQGCIFNTSHVCRKQVTGYSLLGCNIQQGHLRLVVPVVCEMNANPKTHNKQGFFVCLFAVLLDYKIQHICFVKVLH